jgi:nitroreductase
LILLKNCRHSTGRRAGVFAPGPLRGEQSRSADRLFACKPRFALDAPDHPRNVGAMSTDAETLHRLMTARFSCRAFHADPIPEETVQEIVATARHAPSWCNAQPWQLVITRPEETDRFRDALHAHAASGAAPDPDMPWPKDYPGVYGDRRRAVGWQLYGAVGIEKGDREAGTRQALENFRFFGAPHVALLHSPAALGPYGALDCGGFVMAFCLAAQARGIATVPQAAVASHGDFVRDWFGIPEDRLILCAISFGLPDMDHAANSFRAARDDAESFIDWRG